MSEKISSILDSVNLQPHQQRIADEVEDGPVRKLLYWGLGSGKSLGSLAAAENLGEPYTVIVPAALRENYKAEQQKFTDKAVPSQILSYSELARGKEPIYPDSLVFDEAHRLRNQEGAASRKAKELANKAKQVVLLTGTPTTNRPGDMASLVSMMTGEPMDADSFEKRYIKKQTVTPTFLQKLMYGVTPGEELVPIHKQELKELLKGKVDYYSPEKPVVPVNREDHVVEMSPQQTRLYNAMWHRLPFVTRWKIAKDFPLSNEELMKMRNFLSGPRQVSLSTMPFLKNKNPYTAFTQSPKLQKAVELLKDKLKDERTKALVFSNFIDAGLTPYSAALEKEQIPHALFYGGLNDAQRKQLIDDYNNNKLRVALIGPAGMEGLSFKGTQLIQKLDDHFHAVRPRQAEGRALRFDSHDNLPDDLKNVLVQRFVSRLPATYLSRLKARLLGRQPDLVKATDDHLEMMSRRKEKLNENFLQLLREVGSQGK